MRNLGTAGYCADHLAALYATFDPSTFALHGVGLPVGADSHHLACVACRATWWGLAGEECTWCLNTWQRMLAEQAELVLRPPGLDPDDIDYDRHVVGWTDRLWTAVKAGLVDERTARRIIEGEVRRGALRQDRPDDQPVQADPRTERLRPPGAPRMGTADPDRRLA